MEAVLRQLEQNAKFNLEQERNETSIAKRKVFLTAYEKDQLSFFAGVLTSMPQDLRSDRVKLYSSADQIIAVSNKFNDKVQKQHLWGAWQIVSAARDLALKDKSQRDPDIYVEGAKQTFDALINVLPDDFKELEVLYRAEKFDRIDHYLQQILLTDFINDQTKMQSMRKEIDEQKSIISKQELDAIAAQRRRRGFFKKIG